MEFDWQFVTSVLQILIIDVVLSGDNAVVIAMAAHRLPERQRKVAILCGAGGAIVLRVFFTYVLAQLLGIPLLRFGGGIVLVWIAMKLLMEEEGDEHKAREASGLVHAIWIIVMADFVMSLDNMLAVGGASEGHASLILFGLFLSIAIIMTCSAVIARLMNRYPILIVLGAAVLAWTAAEMLLQDSKVAEYLVSKQSVCLHSSWHEEFGAESAKLEPERKEGHKPKQPAEWWTNSQDRLNHRHWLGTLGVFAIVGLVIAVPRIRQSIAKKPGEQHPPATPIEAAPPPTPANPPAPPPINPTA